MLLFCTHPPLLPQVAALRGLQSLTIRAEMVFEEHLRSLLSES